MVWGMSLPSGFGEFWPLGDFEGLRLRSGSNNWSERLKDHYRAQTPEEQKTLFDYVNTGEASTAHWYPGYVSKKFISECGARLPEPNYPPPTPIQPHEAPRFFQTEKGYKSLGSLIALNFGLLAVDEALKAIIERLEPGVHHFFPLEIRLPQGKVYPGQYYTLAIGQYFGSFSPEDSKEGSCELDIVRFRYEKTKAGVSGLAFRKSVFGKAHLWRERSIIGLLTCFSDELKAEMAQAGLRIPKHYKMKQV